MNLLKANILPIGLGVLGLLLILIGIFQMVSKSSQKEPLAFDETKADSEEQALIVVDIEGAVINPGVYKISSQSRIVDALAAAGGMSEEADRLYVQKNINLAKKVTDGVKIYIPRAGEQVLSQAADAAGPVININTASQSDLESLPGIGAVTAQKIIEGRPYSDISDLTNRKIVGQSVFDKIKDKIAAN
ncbi:MAG: ComEA family DNA-binding protein [Candidatus Levybacteria bacterium]|nr:ComEA family DNA-binding protein [Candidatus Levybacteria bacterium]